MTMYEPPCEKSMTITVSMNRTEEILEKLERNPGRLIPEHLRKAESGDAVAIDLNKPMPEILAELSRYPVKTRLSLTGPNHRPSGSIF